MRCRKGEKDGWAERQRTYDGRGKKWMGEGREKLRKREQKRTREKGESNERGRERNRQTEIGNGSRH